MGPGRIEVDGADCERVVQTRDGAMHIRARRISERGVGCAGAENGHPTKSYPVGRPVASTSLNIKIFLCIFGGNEDS